MDAVTKEALSALRQQIELSAVQVQHLHLRLTIHHFVFLAIFKTHPEPSRLLKEFKVASEHLLADSLSRDYHEGILDVVRQELAGIEEGLHFLASRPSP